MSAAPAWTVVACLVTATSGCGRRATEADCQLIVNRSVELRLKALALTDPAAVQKQEDRVRVELAPQISSCEGRRVTQRMMDCVKGSSSPQQLDQCLR